MPGTTSRSKTSGRLSRAVPRVLPAAVPRILRTTAPRGLPAAVPWAASLYVGAVQLGAYATARLPRRRRTELLRTHSTNVENLRAGRWQTLATSAVFVEEPLPVPYGAALLAALGTAEARWGVWRAAGVFAAGHAGASLLVYGALRRRTRQGTPSANTTGASPARAAEETGTEPPDTTARAIDVGASYGFNATVGALAATVPHHGARAAATAGLLALGVRPVLRRGRTFTDVGHLAALVIGVALGTGMRVGTGTRAGAEIRTGANARIRA
ncbi:rhomboid-like protein [Streptomyces decoyicus]|uniref:rhomboid-like protein n=1 Tax=Streptomyces decoyicus TaxID=249567 RepID=UPI003668E474